MIKGNIISICMKLLGVIILLFIVGCGITGMIIRNPICNEVPFLYKIDDKPMFSSYCSHYKQYCSDKSWWTGNCVKWESECDEKTVKCSIKIKNYENKKGNFGLRANFKTENGEIEKPTIWKEIYPNEEETFIWTYVTRPSDYDIICTIITEHIPKKEEC